MLKYIHKNLIKERKNIMTIEEKIKEEIKKTCYTCEQVQKYNYEEGWNPLRAVECPTVSRKARAFLRTEGGQVFLTTIKRELLENIERAYNTKALKLPQYEDIFEIENPNPVGRDWTRKYVLIMTPWY